MNPIPALPILHTSSSSTIRFLMLLLHILLGLLSLHIPSWSAATDTISPGHAVAGNDRLVSSNGKFALGFFQPGKSSHNTLNTYLGIWFNNVPKLTPVWTANGDKPVVDPTSPELTISDGGNLVILDQATKSIIWSTQANITTNDTVAVLSNSGNLILQSSSNSSSIMWQSFDYPTDTLLPGAKIGWNKATGLNRRLVSRKNLIDQATGLYSLEMELTGIGHLLWNSTVQYWSSGEWNGRYYNLAPEMIGAAMPNFTFVNNDQEIYFTYTLRDENAIVHCALDVFGRGLIGVWLDGLQDWLINYRQPLAQCDVYAICGPFTTCNDNKDPFCHCMKGFSIRSPMDWELGDRRGGCMRNTPLNCGTNKNEADLSDRFYSMTDISLPQNAQNIEAAKSGEECSQVCLSNCSCTAYSYGKGGCSVWYDSLLNMKQQQDSDTTGTEKEILYLRLAAKEVQRLKRKGNRNGMITGVAIGSSIAALGLIFLLMIWMRNRRLSTLRLDNVQGGIGIIAFRYADLQRATKGFSEKLGGGSFGSVFEGFIGDSTAIAVKRLDGARQGEKQFRAEVSSIGIIQHINLVKLIGFCCEGDRRLLVYEYMPNGSLDSHLFQRGGIALNWTIRYQIALGVARGLAYLHDSCRDCIIHCDIKPQNILLDASFVPKVADFGMAKVLGREFSRVVTTIRGTIGYLAPEWISGTDITPKVDVYSYGMVLLEIISGRRNSHREYSSHGDHPPYFPVKVACGLLNGDVGNLVDANLHGDVNLEEVERVCKVACWCIQDNELDRPTMGEVVQFLECLSELKMPPMPRLLNAIAGDSHSTSL